ncbi:hypothetical protein [Peptostreptococcus equinus]|uniref:Uncharacterized protein n=1 Tax=Peptostreptococcus equinus TaxID=3003601 RepID=A0ABY7JQH7_9FIRM|nr:hypothetical protein [Peptostreptococcus sp. CBA3647]WAW14761.1 hypothetical protein O0R46_09270 [Peptostreptococcus sp. CBA3647]
MFFRSDKHCDFCGSKEIIIKDSHMVMYKCIKCGTVHGILPMNKLYKEDNPCYMCPYRAEGCHSYYSGYGLLEQKNKEKYKLRARKFEIDTYVNDEVTRINKRIRRW